MAEEDYGRTLDLLKQLQDWQLEVVRLERSIERVPDEIAELEQDIEERATAVRAAEEAQQEETKRNSRLEGELADAQSRLSHSNEQILMVKTNEQLWALQKEIEFAKDKISNLETLIIESMEQLDAGRVRLAEAKSAFERGKADNETRIGELRQRLEKMRKELERKRDGQEEIRGEIPKRYLQLFERIQHAKGGEGGGGLAVAVARDETCQVCNVRILPQVYMQVRHRHGIFQCDNCRRILYYEGEPPLENPAELS